MIISRRSLLAGTAAGAASLWLGGCSSEPEAPPSPFVGRDGQRLVRAGAPYRIIGANMWYAAWLGADAPYGNRERLVRELDRLQSLGINNLRIMAAAEEGPLNNSIKPGFTANDGTQTDVLAAGLDFAMAEIGKRGMTAVLVLSNFWEWSGGLQTLLYRATGSYIDMGDPEHPWPAFADATAEFYGNEAAIALYHQHLRSMVARVNSVTGTTYIEDPAVMSWQLANEPRPGGSDEAIARNRENYLRWIARTASIIRSIDGNHMVSLGQEGTQATNGSEELVTAAHEHVDYVTAHIWPLNWGWVSGDDLEGTWPAASELVANYIETHTRIAAAMDKPLLIEEFGFPRDDEAYSPDAATGYREQYYRMIYEAVEKSWSEGGPLQGSNFWAWNGEARAAHEDARFKDGDLAYMGDPPHEPQGWYGIFDSDNDMLGLIREHAAKQCVGIEDQCPA